MRKKSSTPLPRLEPCNVCHRPVRVDRPCTYMRTRCLDCAWESPGIYVFCSERCAQQWTPPAIPPHEHAGTVACVYCGDPLDYTNGFVFNLDDGQAVHPSCFSYRSKRGAIPPGFTVGWTCPDAHRCVNPAHLKLVRNPRTGTA